MPSPPELATDMDAHWRKWKHVACKRIDALEPSSPKQPAQLAFFPDMMSPHEQGQIIGQHRIGIRRAAGDFSVSAPCP